MSNIHHELHNQLHNVSCVSKLDIGTLIVMYVEWTERNFCGKYRGKQRRRRTTAVHTWLQALATQ